jgi:hypothetical protein
MKVLTLGLVLLAATSVSNRLQAQDYKLAMGIRFSSASPTLNNAVSVKYFMNETNAVEGLLSFGNNRFGIGGLYEKHQLIGATPGFTWFYGGGGYLGFENRTDANKVEKHTTFLGPTGIVGIDYKFQSAPINLSLDWKPELDIIPSINFVPDAFALTARFTF